MFTLIFVGVVLFYTLIIGTIATVIAWFLDVGIDILRIALDYPMWVIKMKVKKIRKMLEEVKRNY